MVPNLGLDPLLQVLIPPKPTGKQDRLCHTASLLCLSCLRLDKSQDLGDDWFKQLLDVFPRDLELATPDAKVRGVGEPSSGYEVLLLQVAGEIALDVRLPSGQGVSMVSVIPAVETRELATEPVVKLSVEEGRAAEATGSWG